MTHAHSGSDIPRVSYFLPQKFLDPAPFIYVYLRPIIVLSHEFGPMKNLQLIISAIIHLQVSITIDFTRQKDISGIC